MTFGELKQICNQTNGKLFAKSNEYTDEIYLCCYRNDVREVWLIVDEFEGEPISKSAKEICLNLSDAEDIDIVKILYTDTLADIAKTETKNKNVYLHTE
jgi:hypothetical protein